MKAQLVAALKESLQKASSDPQVKVIVLKANGKAFCAGADLEYLQQLQKNTYEENLTDSGNLAELFHLIYTLPKVVIAQVQGHAIAGGCGLASICDFVFSVPEAKFGYTEVKIGFIPAIVSLFLIRKIGEGKARELLLAGDLISAEKAQAYGLINFLAEEYELENRVRTFTEQLCVTNSGQSMTLTKDLLARIGEMNLSDGVAFAAQMNAKARATDDCKQGIQAFLDKKDLNW